MVSQHQLVAVMERLLAVIVQKALVDRCPVGGVVIDYHPATSLEGQIAMLVAHSNILG